MCTLKEMEQLRHTIEKTPLGKGKYPNYNNEKLQHWFFKQEWSHSLPSNFVYHQHTNKVTYWYMLYIITKTSMLSKTLQSLPIHFNHQHVEPLGFSMNMVFTWLSIIVRETYYRQWSNSRHQISDIRVGIEAASLSIENAWMLTVIGLGSRIRAISFMAPNDSQGGQVNSPAEICR